MRRATKKKTEAPRGLLSTRALLEKLGFSERTLYKYCQQGLPIAKRGKGRALSFFRLSDVEEWIAEHVEGAVEKDFRDSDETSPFLEKYREERYRREKRLNDIAEGRLLEMDQAREELQVIFGKLRARLEAVGRAHGPAVADALKDAIDGAAQDAEEKFPAPPSIEPAAAPASPEPQPAAPASGEAKAS
jgi:phage terminase Nu1 subunit (DNA packaging protein)